MEKGDIPLEEIFLKIFFYLIKQKILFDVVRLANLAFLAFPRKLPDWIWWIRMDLSETIRSLRSVT